MPQNRFMKNQKMVLFISLAAILMVMVFGFEKYLAWATPKEKKGVSRHIRLKEWEPMSVRFMIPDDRDMTFTDSLVQKEYRLQIDEDGFIYPSRLHDDPDVKIFFLGGSTTECLCVDENNRFPYLAGRLLEKEGRKVNSYNSGVSGNNTLHQTNILLNKIIPYDPDIVVMMENINDLTILMYEGGYWNRNPSRAPIVYEPENALLASVVSVLKDSKELFIPHLSRKIKSFLVNARHDEFARVRGKKLSINKEDLKGRFRNNLQAFIDLCKAHGITPVLMTQASRLKETPDEAVKKQTSILERDFGVSYSQLKEMFDAFNDVIRKTGADNNVLVIDLAGKVPQEKEYIFDYDHYNDNGSKFVARIIADELEKIIRFSSPSLRSGQRGVDKQPLPTSPLAKGRRAF